MQSWLLYDVMPSPELLSILQSNLEIAKLAVDELVFLYVASASKAKDLANSILGHLIEFSNTSTSILTTYPAMSCTSAGGGSRDSVDNFYFKANITIQKGDLEIPVVYCYSVITDNEFVEMFLFQQKNFGVLIRFFKEDDKKEMELIHQLVEIRQRTGKY